MNHSILRSGSITALWVFLKSVGPIGWLKASIYSLLLAVAYRSALEQLVLGDWQSEDWSYCQIVPLIALYLAWNKRNEFASAKTAFVWYGLIPLGLGVILSWAGELAGAYTFLYLSLWLLLIGLLWTQFGFHKTATLWFPLIVLLAAFPVPSVLSLKASVLLKLISSQLGVFMLRVVGVSAFREGNVIDLGFTQLQVADACSGLRYVFPLMLIALLLAYWFKAHIWKRLVLLLSSIPLAVAVNGLRIALTGILWGWFGESIAEGFFHGLAGWLIFMLTIPWLLIEMYVLRLLPPKQREKAGIAIEEGPSHPDVDFECRKAPRTGKPGSRLAPVALFVLPVLFVLIAALPSRVAGLHQELPTRTRLELFPLNIAGATGSHQILEKIYLDKLALSDYAVINYRDPQDREVNLYIAYYESQLKGKGLHLPDSCLPGEGWFLEETGTRNIALAGGKTLTVNRILMEKMGVRELTYYWFPQRGRSLSSDWQLRLFNFWDAVTKGRSDGALLRLITPIYGPETVEAAENRLQDFARHVAPLLKDYIPD
jgi:exosortase D (VPLPA-CTERM-specific)